MFPHAKTQHLRQPHTHKRRGARTTTVFQFGASFGWSCRPPLVFGGDAFPPSPLLGWCCWFSSLSGGAAVPHGVASFSPLLLSACAALSCLFWLTSIQNYVIKKVRPHGHRFGKTKEQRDHHIAHNLRKGCIKRNFEGIHDRFLKDPTFRESQLEHDRTEEVCIQMDKDAQKDFTYRMTQDEYFRYTKSWWLSLNTSGKIGPVRNRSDFNGALTTLHRLHQKSGEEQLAPISFWQYQQWHPPSSSSSSTSWWQWNDSWWNS